MSIWLVDYINKNMVNKLTFSSVHKSISQFDEVTLPNFVVLTGRNGSGKTHLLSAINTGKIKSSLVVDVKTDVRIFDSSTIVPTDTGIFDPAEYQTQRSQWFNVIESSREKNFPTLQQFILQLGLPGQYCSSIKAIQSLTTEKLTEILKDPLRAIEVNAKIKDQIKSLGLQISQFSLNQIGDEHWRKVLPKIQQTLPESFFLSSRSTFFKNENFLWGDIDPFKQAFGRVFTTYRELIHDNDRLEKYPPKEDPSRRHLSATEFIEEFGTPPWNFVNQILEECRLDFRVDGPPLHETTSYEPKLQKLSIPVEMRFQDLSSGEKVLMSFALCLYNSQDNRQAKVFPKLLLLDEVDAPLHPSMTLSLLKTIQNVLVRDKNVAVILTTHSPSTVALAPEESIYSMNPAGPRVEKISKSSALSLLTTGVPTLSVSFDGRRQIFVESRTDASLYDSLYQRYKGYLNSERSLVFVEVGKRDDSGCEQNSGCVQVIRLVEALTSGGNMSVFGLVDWDGERIPESRLHVLSPDIRDGLESLLFDPVLLVATIARENLAFGKEKKIFDPEDSYISISTWKSERWQRAIGVLQNIILGSSQSTRESIQVQYMNDMNLSVAKEYLHLDDHALEQKIVNSFSFLKPKNKRAGDLMRYVADTILADFPHFLPKDLLVTFAGLIEAELE
jgi:predicted ATPase